MRLEGVSVQADNREDAAAFANVITERLVGSVVEPALRQHDGHAPAGFQEIKVALNEQQVAPDGGFVFAAGFLAEVVFGDDARFLDVAGKGRIRHEHVEIEFLPRAFVPAEFFRRLKPSL